MDLGILLAGGAGGDVIVASALIGTLGLGAQWLAWRLQAPAIVLMSLAGLAVGPLWSVIFGDPLLNPSDSFGDVFRPIVSLAVAVILFEGGLVL
ncbi:MAG: sodium:proton antiporter, partial [Pseudomonadota bacterium]